MKKLLNRIVDSLVYRLAPKKPKFLNYHEEILDLNHGEERVTIADPENIDEIEAAWSPQSHFKNYSIRPARLISLQDVYISHHGAVYRGFHVLKESLVYDNFLTKFSFDYLFLQRHKKTIVLNTVYHVWDHWSAQNYFHWLLDTLIRICILTKYRPNDKVMIALPDNLPKYALESLKAFPEVYPVFFSNEEKVKTCFLQFIDYPVSSGLSHPKYLPILRESILKKVVKERKESGGGSTSKKVYISRSKASQRRICNEQELLDILIPAGFKQVFTEDLSFWEQVNLASHAEVIVSPHGAGLSNIVFMNRGSTVIEINQANTEDATLCYWNLAKNIGLKYYYVPSTVDTLNDFTLTVNNLAQIENLIKPLISLS